MGTVSDKLTYLNTTKGKIKDSINLTGAGITDQDTFRSYETKLKDGFVDIINNGVDTLYENFPKVSQTGEEPTLNGVYEAPMRVDLNGNTEQDSYSGKNLCSSAELQSAANVRFYIDKKIEKTLTISFTTNESLNNNSLYLSATNTLATTITADANTKATATFTLSDEQYNAIQSETNSYFLLYKNKANFTVPTDAQIENGSTPTSFEPYVGGIPSPNPDYPQPIRVVKGNNTIKVTGKNLCSSAVFYNSNAIYMYFDVKKLAKTFTLSLKPNTTSSGIMTIYAFVDGSNLGNISTITLTSGEVCTKSITISDSLLETINAGTSGFISIYRSNAEMDITTSIDQPQIENNSSFTSYQPYTSTDYPLNLGTTEVCKIEDYQDYIYKENDKWYLKKNIGKIDLSTLTWSSAGSDTSDYRRYYTNTIPNIKYVSSNTQVGNGIAEKYKIVKGQGISNLINVLAIDVSIVSVIDLESNNNPTGLFYYALATPTIEEITATTLIEQLEDLKTAKSVEGQTNITQTNEELPFILDVSGLKKD